MIVKTVERAIAIYTSMAKHPIGTETRANLSRYLDLLFAGGETDENRLTELSLAYLRCADLRKSRNS